MVDPLHTQQSLVKTAVKHSECRLQCKVNCKHEVVKFYKVGKLALDLVLKERLVITKGGQ